MDQVIYLISLIPPVLFSLILWGVIVKKTKFKNRPVNLLRYIINMSLTGIPALIYLLSPNDFNFLYPEEKMAMKNICDELRITSL